MSAHYEAATSRPLIKEPIDVHSMPKDHKSRSGWKIKAAEKPCNIFEVLLWKKTLLPGTVNDPCLRNKSLYARCVLARPFNIHSHRRYIPLSGRKMPRLSSHSPLLPLQQNAALFFSTLSSGVLVCHGGHVWGERESESASYLFVAVSSPVRIKRATRSQSENIISL